MVRIISGSARGRILKSPQGMATRPTLDRTRESLFNILATSSFYEKRVLDIFAGTGALGLEAMSRGASEGVFIDVRTASLIKKMPYNIWKGKYSIISLQIRRMIKTLSMRRFQRL